MESARRGGWTGPGRVGERQGGLDTTREDWRGPGNGGEGWRVPGRGSEGHGGVDNASEE